MGNASSYQRNYFYPKVAALQAGEYCKGCGISKDSKFYQRQKNGLLTIRNFTGLRLDKINNDGNHNICDNEPEDFQLLCISCNLIKNPRGHTPIINREMSHSEHTNKRAEKPLMDWLYLMLEKGETVTWKYFVSEGAYKFDISVKTIKERYYEKYFEAPSGPFKLLHDQKLGEDIIILKKRDDPAPAITLG